MIERASPATTTWADEVFDCKGPFAIPIAIDGVWVYQLGVVTSDKRTKQTYNSNAAKSKKALILGSPQNPILVLQKGTQIFKNH